MQQQRQPEWVQLKLPFPPRQYDVVEIIDLLLKSDRAVERGIIRIQKELVAGNVDVSNFKSREDAEACVRFSQWLQGMNSKGTIKYEPKSLCAKRLASQDAKNLVSIFSKYCDVNQSVLQKAREICIHLSVYLTHYANN